MSNSTFSGNTAGYYGGGGIYTYAPLTVSNSTFSANTAGAEGGGGIYSNSVLTLSNSIVAGNTVNDCYGCGTQSSSNLIGGNSKLAPLGNYGGPMQTMLPLPGSPAICAGFYSLVSSGVTTDQRGYPNTNTTYTGYSSNAPCVDAGAVQTNYQSVQFTNAGGGYSGTVNHAISPAPVVSVTENGQNMGGVPVTLGFSGTGTASGLGPVTTVAGTGAAFNSLSVSMAGNDTLSAFLPIVGSYSLNANAGLNIIPTGTSTTISAPTSTYGSTASVTVSVTSAQGTVSGTVSLTVDNGSPSIQSLSNGATVFTINGLAGGSHSLSAIYAAQNNFGASSATGTLQVNQATPSVTIGNIPSAAVYGGNFTVTYAYTGDGTTSVASSTASTCTVSGNVVNFVGGGTCTLTAHAAATANYAAVTGNPQSFTIGQATTTVSVNNIPTSAVYGGNFTPTYTYTGNGLASVTSSTNATCTVSGSTVNFVGAGTCTLTAHATGTTNYAAATGTPQSFSIAQSRPTISISDIPTNAQFAGSFTPTYAYAGDGSTSVTSSTTTTCTVSGTVVNFVGLGTCTLIAHATATVNSAAATGSPQSFSVGQATPSVSISNIPANAIYGGSFTPTYSYIGNGRTSTTSGTLGTCTVSSRGVVSFLAPGTCTLTAHATATTNYAAANGSPQSFTIGQATATISIRNIPNNARRGGTFTPTYNYIGDGTPSTTSSTLSTCAVSSGVVNFVAAGTCTVTAQATGGINYAATTGTPQSFQIR